jgi:hypothetical protein
MLLLHGEENLERFRSETACAVYQLPWLSPGDAMNYSGELTELVPLFEKPLPSPIAPTLYPFALSALCVSVVKWKK